MNSQWRDAEIIEIGTGPQPISRTLLRPFPVSSSPQPENQIKELHTPHKKSYQKRRWYSLDAFPIYRVA